MREIEDDRQQFGECLEKRRSANGGLERHTIGASATQFEKNDQIG